jgi:hypothetical protein
LETLHQFAKQSGISGFVNNADHAATVAGLVEDTRDVIMDYQVRSPQHIQNQA